MSLFRVVCDSQQEDFESLEKARKFINDFPAGTPGEITALAARPGDVSTYNLISGEEGTLERSWGNKV